MQALRARLWKRILAPVCAFALSGCLFSSTPPERNDPTTPDDSNDPSAAIVRGLVLLGDSGDYHARPGWSVQAAWYKGATTTPQDLLTVQVVKANSYGVYEARLKDRRVARAVLRPLLCSFDPTDPAYECCLDPRSPCGACPQAWGAATVRSVAVGMAVNEVNLTSRCAP